MPARRTTASTRAQEMKAKLNTPTKVAKKGVFGSLRGALGQSSFQLAENVTDPEEDGTDSSSQEDEDEQEAPEAEVTPAPTRRGSSKKKTLSVKGGGVGKKKSATPKTPKEMKNPKTHFTAKINQLNKAIAKATDNEIDAIDRINRHRDVLQQTNNKVCRDFINLQLSKFIFNEKEEFKNALYKDTEGMTASYAHNLAELLRGLADYVDSENAEAEALQEELEEKKKEFAKWQLEQTLLNTNFTREELRAMLG